MTTKRKEDRRIRQSRKRLQAALIQLLREKPLAKIQIKEIVEVADVSRPTFYQHFETKEKLLFSHIDDLFERIRAVVFTDLGEGDVLDLHSMLITSFVQWQLHSEELKWVLQVENKDLLIGALRMHIESIRGELKTYMPNTDLLDDYEDYVLEYFAGGVYMLLKNWLGNGMQESAEQMGTLTFLLLPNGFAPFQSGNATTQLTAIKQLRGD